jgi:hypothetical protein
LSTGIFAQLSPSWGEADPLKVAYFLDTFFGGKMEDHIAHLVLERGASGNQDAKRNRAVCVKSLVILKIAIKEWVFVVPFNLKSDCPCGKSRNVIDLVRDRLALDAVDGSPNLKLMLAPPVVVESAAKALSAFRLSAPRSYNFFDGDRCINKNRL